MKHRNFFIISVSTAILVLGFQNCGQSNVNFGSTNEKVDDTAVDDSIVICNDLLDCDTPPKETTQEPPSTTSHDESSDDKRGRVKDEHECEQRNEEHKNLVCDGYAAADLKDAVVMVRRIVLVGANGKVDINYEGPVTLNGFEVEVPASLSGSPISIHLDIAESGHYFVTSDGTKIPMDKMTALHSRRRSIRADVTRTPDGAYLLSADWSTRLHPGNHHCGLLPLRKFHH